VDPTRSQLALPAGHPFGNVQSLPPTLFSFYWSATTVSVGGTSSFDAWVVTFDVGAVNTTYKFNESFVWCVRGGQGVDPQ
jgi:hypothetical protein